MLCNVNGRFVESTAAAIAPADSGFRYGDGVFETMRVYNGQPHQLDAHLDRLERGVNTLGMGWPGRSLLRDRLEATLEENDLAEASLRLSVTRGVTSGKLEATGGNEPTVVVHPTSLPRGGLEGAAVWEGPTTASVVSITRPTPSVLPTSFKTHNYLPQILARRQANAAGAAEAIMLSSDGVLSAATTSNLFLIKDGTVYTPDRSCDCLPGTTREMIFDIAESLSIPLERGRYDPSMLDECDDAFLTNSTWEIRPIGSIETRGLPGSPLRERLQSAFSERIERRYYD